MRLAVRNYIFGICIITTLLLGCLIVARRLQQQSVAGNKARARMELTNYWQACHFERIAKEHIEALLDQVPVLKRTELSPLQEKELHQTLVATFMAFTAGSYETYQQFLRPVPSSINPARLELIRKAMSGLPVTLPESTFQLPPELRGKKIPPNRPPKNPIAVPSDSEEVVKLHFSRATDGTSFRGWWESLCVTQSLVMIESSKVAPKRFSKAVMEDARDYGTNYWGIADFSLMPIYTYSMSAQDTLAADGAITFASTRWLISLKKPDPTTPFLVRYYWNSKFQKWVPWELLMGNERKSRITPVF